MTLPEAAKRKETALIYHAALLITAIIWASTFINIKIVLLEVSPNTLAFMRFFIASIVLGIYFIHKGLPNIKRQDWLRVAIGGLTGITLYNFFQNQGLKYAGATDAAIIAASAPIFMVILAWLYLKEKITARQSFGIFLALSGSVLVSTNGSLDSFIMEPLRFYGDALILLTGVSWAVYNINIKTLLEKYPATSVLTYCTFAGTVFLLPFMLMEFPINLISISFAGWLNVFYLGLMASALAYLFWNTALTKVSMTTAAMYLYLMPVISAVFAAIFLNEIPTTYTIIGGAIVLIGTYIAGK